MTSESTGQLDRTKPLGVAIVGAGMVAGTHMAAVEAASDFVKLRGVLSRRPSRAEALLSDFPGLTVEAPQVFRSIDDVATDPDVDFAIVITPPNVRQEIIAPLAKAGKHVLLEKPVARNISEARALVDLCTSHDVQLGIVFQHRCREASIKAQELIQSGQFGRLALAEISVPWWRDQSYYDELGRGTYARDGGGVLISQAIHTVDLAISLTGPVAAVQAMTGTTRLHKMEAEDFAIVGLEFASGAIGSLTASTASYPGTPESILLHFENATLRLQSGVLTVNWRNGHVDTYGETASTGGGADPMAFTFAWHQAVIEDFAIALRAGRPPLVTGEAALASHALIDAIETSARTGHKTTL